MTSLPTPYQEYIALSRYARWIPEKNRREYWPETVDRYIDFFAKRFPEIPQKTLDKARNAIVSLDVMPSMRALMTAGKALELSELAGYNCSYLAIDSIRSF
jgi:ribonucleoside-diphosphate reductase alpha chain